jgi:hypothetical protein
MKKVFFILVCLMGLTFSSLSYSSETHIFVNTTSTIQIQLDEWIEYVQIDGQWYKITHLEDGSTIIQANGIPAGGD